MPQRMFAESLEVQLPALFICNPLLFAISKLRSEPGLQFSSTPPHPLINTHTDLITQTTGHWGNITNLLLLLPSLGRCSISLVLLLLLLLLLTTCPGVGSCYCMMWLLLLDITLCCWNTVPCPVMLLLLQFDMFATSCIILNTPLICF